jgi:hypothetical protein
MKVRLELTVLDSRDKIVSFHKQVMNIQYRGIYEVLIERIFIEFEILSKIY